jgi:hypothetical protein
MSLPVLKKLISHFQNLVVICYFMYRILVCRSSHTSSTAERVRGAVHKVGPSLGVAAVAVAAAARRAHLVSAKETFQLL